MLTGCARRPFPFPCCGRGLSCTLSTATALSLKHGLSMRCCCEEQVQVRAWPGDRARAACTHARHFSPEVWEHFEQFTCSNCTRGLRMLLKITVCTSCKINLGTQPSASYSGDVLTAHPTMQVAIQLVVCSLQSQLGLSSMSCTKLTQFAYIHAFKSVDLCTSAPQAVPSQLTASARQSKRAVCASRTLLTAVLRSLLHRCLHARSNSQPCATSLQSRAVVVHRAAAAPASCRYKERGWRVRLNVEQRWRQQPAFSASA